MRKWRNSGANNTTSMVVKIVNRDGCSNAVNKLSGPEGMASAPVCSVLEFALAAELS